MGGGVGGIRMPVKGDSNPLGNPYIHAHIHIYVHIQRYVCIHTYIYV